MKLVRIVVSFLILLIKPCMDFIIPGKLFTNQPINTIPKKSNILPKNPLVLLDTRAPCLFVTP